MEKMNSEKFSEKITLSKEDEDHYIREVEYYCDKNRCSEDKAIHALCLDYLKETGIFEVGYKRPNPEQDLSDTFENMECPQISEDDYNAAEKLMDKTGISMNEALTRLGLIDNGNPVPVFENTDKLDGLSVIASPKPPSVDIPKRNVCLRKALELSLKTTQGEGYIHKVEKDDDDVDPTRKAKKNDREYKAANKFLDAATGIDQMRKAGVDEEIIENMARDYHKNFRFEETGSLKVAKRNKLCRDMAHQVDVYGIYDVEPWPDEVFIKKRP